MTYQESDTDLKFNIIKNFLKTYTVNNHGIYISFRTYSNKVELNEHLKLQHPDEITIVLEHQFDNLKITKDKFSVNLYFNGELEYISVPYDAITRLISKDRDIEMYFNLTEEDLVQESYSLIEKTIDNFVNQGLLNQNLITIKEINIKKPKKISKSNSKNKKRGEIIYFPTKEDENND